MTPKHHRTAITLFIFASALMAAAQLFAASAGSAPSNSALECVDGMSALFTAVGGLACLGLGIATLVNPKLFND